MKTCYGLLGQFARHLTITLILLATYFFNLCSTVDFLNLEFIVETPDYYAM